MSDRLASRPLLQLLIVLAASALVYLPFLGTRPLDFSEGHRAVPGWTMLESHDYWHIKMFGLTYIRKPPGMPWAIALSSSVFGETTFAARLPSAVAAILMSGFAWWHGRRWFGGSGGVIAGLAQALFPLMWSPGRTAEIEMLNNLGTQMFALGLVDLLVGKATRKAAPAATEEGPFGFLGELASSTCAILIPLAGIMIAGLAKGPASAPILGGVLIAACLATRSIRTIANPRLGVTLIFAGGLLALLGMKIYLANSDPDAVREDVAGQFLWNSKHMWGVATLIPLAFASALPCSLALLVPKGTSNARGDGVAAHTLAWAWLCSVGILVLSGVSNARYAMPAAVLLPLLAPFAVAAIRPWIEATPLRRRVLGSPVRWALVMGYGAWLFVALTGISPTPDQRAGPRAATDLLPKTGIGIVWANDAIEARPDVAWLIQQREPRVLVQWKKREFMEGKIPPRLGFLLLRTDPGSVERGPYEGLIQNGTLIRVGTARVRTFEFTTYWVERDLPAP